MNLLLLRGLSREQRHWSRFPSVLQAHSPGLRLHFLDLPGAGTEHQRPTPLTVREISEDIRARWTTLQQQHEGPWAIFAMSLGGMVAMQWCADHPEDFERAILANTSAGNLSVPWRRLDWRVMPGIYRALRETDPVKKETIILSITTKLHRESAETAREWATYQADRPVLRATVLRQLWAASRFKAPAKLSMPVLVLAGEADPLTDPSCPKRIAERFGAELRVCPGAGHELALDAPQWLSEQIGGWLQPATRLPQAG